jgi:hypothetical protein
MEEHEVLEGLLTEKAKVASDWSPNASPPPSKAQDGEEPPAVLSMDVPTHTMGIARALTLTDITMHGGESTSGECIM